MATHVVLNQPPPLEGYNLFDTNVALREALTREGGDWFEPEARKLGEIAGGEPLRWGAEANEHPPVLKTHDRFGNRIDEVEFHPSWHKLMTLAVSSGVHSLPWREPRVGAHVARASLMIMMSAVEAGHGCPISMTYAGVAALRAEPALSGQWEPPLTSLTYDPRLIPVDQKAGALCGMAMTEKQGGSDLRANTTRAEPVGTAGPASEYLLTGHKWFCSAPMCDAFLVLANAPAGLSCFLLPRVLPDGTRNRFFIQRLKDKLGNRSNASSEVEFDRTTAFLVGEEGRGVPTIIEMVNYTRLDCVLGSTGLMRAAVAQATHHTAYRSAFGKRLIDQPLMLNVLADLCIESEAATVTAMRLARATDEAFHDEHTAAFKRLATAVCKYWICKAATWHVAEAVECLGGNGYVEESGMPRLYRETPLNSIWEGSGNVNCLDVLRAMQRSPGSVDAFRAELDVTSGADAALDRHIDEIWRELSSVEEIEIRARRIVEMMAVALQASLLIRHAPASVADAFVASRVARDRGRAYGTLPVGVDFEGIVERHRPHV
ncbi:MAG: acyl-CoA dehydrogenase family protein [Actinomycetota bacterium]|nr:acyl-CoA dehydrogenase family protein [Actinomycetota bacterium]